jgi:hypothetical protein
MVMPRAGRVESRDAERAPASSVVAADDERTG